MGDGTRKFFTRGFGVLTVVLCFWGVGVSRLAAETPTSPAMAIQHVHGSEAKQGAKALRQALESISENRIVHLDLTFKAGEGREFSRDAGCSDGSFGSIPREAETEFEFSPEPGYTHFRLTILPGSRFVFPFNDVSCVYNPATPGEVSIRFRGFYVAIIHGIPTASWLELRPIALPITQALAALAEE